MGSVTRISKSGQVTVPAQFREKLGVKPGDNVIWSINPNGELVVRPVRFTLDDMVGILGPLPDGMTVDELIHEAVQEGMERKLRRWQEPDE